MDNLLDISVNYKYINDTENTVAFKTFRNSISSEENYTDPSDGSQKEGNFKQTETALTNTNTNFANIQTAINTLEGNYEALAEDVDTYVGQSQIFYVYATMASVEEYPDTNVYVQSYPSNLTQKPQPGAILLLRVEETNSRAATSGEDTMCSVILSVPYLSTSNRTGLQTYRLLSQNKIIPRYALKASNIYMFMLNDDEIFVNVESKITKRLSGNFVLSSTLKNTETFGNSWSTDGSMLYVNLLLGQNTGKVTSSTPVVVANLSANTYTSGIETDWFPATVRSTSIASSNVPIFYIRCKIKNNQLLAIAPGTSSNPTTLNFLMLNVAIPLPANYGVWL